MITHNNGVFKIDTPNTTYMFRVLGGMLQHLYYGAKIGDVNDVSWLADKQGSGQGCSVAIDTDKGKVFADNTCFEFSSDGYGDYRESPLRLRFDDGSMLFKPVYQGYEITAPFDPPQLPHSRNKAQTLAVKLYDDARKITVTLYYSAFDDCDVIVKNIAVTNNGTTPVRIMRAMSNQVDFAFDDFTLVTLNGTWARERYPEQTPLACGITVTDSKRGVSSNAHNPYVALKRADCNAFYGEAYGFNLLYSGNHAEIADKTPLGKVRLLNGINDYDFCWQLNPNQTFYTPEATLCYSDGGTNTLAQRYHRFVNNHIVPERWAMRTRPILINNWEATYFDFTEKKLLDLAKKAADAGIELFVLDDGWFGKRTNDCKGLGDWTVNTKRLPQGLDGLARKINKLGLQFGIWVEPEMVNPDSDLYRAHPNWAVAHPDYSPALCRNQLALDLCNDDVCNYIIDAMSKVFASANIAYVKWDYNRPVTEAYSPALGNNQGEFYYRYMLGLYKILSTLTQKFPDILFEGCASGGNRFDLGILCYMPQIWCSDNTDCFDRVKIHEGTLWAYPQSCIGSHVSASPNHQTLRQSTIDNRFNTACIGAFGYELDLDELNKIDAQALARQIEWYKKYRRTLQFGTYIQLESIFEKDRGSWAVISADGKQAVANVTNGVQRTVPPQDILRVPNLLPDVNYTVSTRPQQFGIKTFGSLVNHYAPVHLKQDGFLTELIANRYPLACEQERYTLSGDMLAKCGIKLNQQWSSTGYDGDTRVMLDFGSRLYSIDADE